jgi:Leucine-rich repeat (LRR) protein
MAISSYFGLQIFIPASLSTALFVFAVVTALMDMRQGIRWLVVLAVVIAESLNFHTFELFALADYLDVNPALRESLQDQTVLHLVIGLGGVLAIHALLWPFRALLGWQVHWAGEAPAAKERLLTIWHLAGPVALVAILLVHSGSSTNPFLLSQFTALLATLAVGLPVLILATRDKHVAFWIPGLLAGLIGLTLAETELTNLISPFAGWMDGFSLSRWGIWNGTVAGTVLFIFFLLRLAGLQFHLPISRPAAGLGQAPVEGTPANSYRRKYQFSLRSVFLLMTLLCLGPGSYIAWERDQCHRGSEALALTEKVLGKQNSTEQRPAWLQAVLGNHGYRQLRLVYTKQTTIADADLACLSGLPNIDTLCLDRTHVTGVGLDSLPNAKNILALQLSGTQVSDEGLVHLAQLGGLRHLTLDKTKVTDAGLVHLSGLTNLRTLLLRDTNLTDDGLAHLTPLVNLEHLHLDNTGVGDAGLNQLPANLKSLRLSGTKVTDTGLVHLTRLTKISYLSLENTNVTDVGLAQLLPLANLEYLFLDNTRVGDAGLNQLPANLKSLAQRHQGDEFRSCDNLSAHQA